MIRPVDRSSPIPYYLQVKDSLREALRQGEWKPGEQIPGEAELCSQFDVSRTVIRQALAELMHDGLIRRRKGKGTFAAEPKITESLAQKLTGFYQDMIDQGYTPITAVFKQQVVAVNAKVAGLLQLQPGAPVLEIERLRSIEDGPVALVTTYLPYHLCPQLLQTDLTRQSLYAFLEHSCGLIIARGRRTLEAVLAEEHEARLLKVPVGAPLIALDSISYLSDGTPIEYYHAYHRGDRSRFEVELLRVREPAEVEKKLSEAGAALPRSNEMI